MSAFDFDAAVTAPFRMQPGLRPVAEGTPALHALKPGSAVLAEKLAVLRSEAASALLCAEGFDPVPGWHALAAEAAQHCPDAIVVDAHGVAARWLGWRLSWDGRRLEPKPSPPSPADAAVGAVLAALDPRSRLAGLLSLALHEDFAIVDGERTTIGALAVCLPSHWVPAEKIGRPFAAVHAPVADNATLIAASRHLMQLVCRPPRWERFVWNVSAHRWHDQHPDRHPRAEWPAAADALLTAAQWRTERQSFIPLPERGQAVFTIHVDVQPLAAAVNTPQRAAALHAALASMSEAVLAYRGLVTARPPLLDALARQAGG
jgi:hypothetical protein